MAPFAIAVPRYMFYILSVSSSFVLLGLSMNIIFVFIQFISKLICWLFLFNFLFYIHKFLIVVAELCGIMVRSTSFYLCFLHT